MSYITVVITTINSDKNKVLKKITNACFKNKSELILIGDKKSPSNFFIRNANFISVSEQKKLDYKICQLLPYNSYSRKNIGYLEAIRKKTSIIIDTDDDNIPYKNFFDLPDSFSKINILKNASWVNVYKYFTKENIWPRGYSLNKILNNNKIYNYNKLSNIYIQQRLADKNPDVDAIYRLTSKLPIYFKKNKNVAILNKSFCPFNSQNTVWRKKAFPLLYLPSFCSFRMTDIFRSYVAQRICSEYSWPILFSSSTVYQERNYHNLLRDFEDEIISYLKIEKFVEILFNLNLSKKYDDIYFNMLKCYNELIKFGFFPKKEIHLLKKFIFDLKKILIT